MASDTYDKILAFVEDNPLATLGTINLDGSPHGAIVYVCADEVKRMVYFITKTETRKFKNLSARDRVSLTIVNPHENSTLQADGRATVIRNAQAIEYVVQKITRAHASAVDWLPPIAKLQAGPYVIVGVEIWHARLAQFKGMQIGDKHIFTQA